MASRTKDDRLDLRLTREQKEEIEQAAAIVGRNVSDFSVATLIEKATETIRHEREIAMSRRSWVEFNEILDRPAATVAGLAALLARPTVFVD